MITLCYSSLVPALVALAIALLVVIMVTAILIYLRLNDVFRKLDDEK